MPFPALFSSLPAFFLRRASPGRSVPHDGVVDERESSLVLINRVEEPERPEKLELGEATLRWWRKRTKE